MIETAKPTDEMTIHELIAALTDNSRRIRNNAGLILEAADELLKRSSLEYAAAVERERDEAVAAMGEAWASEAATFASVAALRRKHERIVAGLEADVERLGGDLSMFCQTAPLDRGEK